MTQYESLGVIPNAEMAVSTDHITPEIGQEC